jgi:ABC-type multidrug transport system fused ATPase/permease subunit
VELVSTIVLYTVILARFAWYLPFAMFCFAPFASYFISKYAVYFYNKIYEMIPDERLVRDKTNILRSREYAKELRVFGAAPHILQDWENRVHDFNKTCLFNMMLFSIKSRLMTICDFLVLLINLGLVLALFASGGITLPLFIAISSRLPDINILEPLKSIMTKYADIKRTRICISKLVSQTAGKTVVDRFPENVEITLNDVSYQCPNTPVQVLTHINFTFELGKKYAVVGENGAGKSTLIKLIAGLLEPCSGSITIGGIPVTVLSNRVLASLLGLAFQDYVRFCMTLKENIFFKKDGNLPPYFDVSKIVEDLPNGEDTLLGKEYGNSVDLSGGQWQKVSLLRAVSGNKKMLILDEPNATLDPVSENKIFNDIIHTARNKTLIFATHRLGITREVDEIIVIEKNSITETGSFEELYRKKGTFYTMFESQRQLYQNRKGNKHHV